MVKPVRDRKDWILTEERQNDIRDGLNPTEMDVFGLVSNKAQFCSAWILKQLIHETPVAKLVRM